MAWYCGQVGYFDMEMLGSSSMPASSRLDACLPLLLFPGCIAICWKAPNRVCMSAQRGPAQPRPIASPALPLTAGSGVPWYYRITGITGQPSPKGNAAGAQITAQTSPRFRCMYLKARQLLLTKEYLIATCNSSLGFLQTRPLAR